METTDSNELKEHEQALCQQLIQQGLLTRNQINDAFIYFCKVPKSELKPFEDILIELELISPAQLAQVKVPMTTYDFQEMQAALAFLAEDNQPTPVKTAELRLSAELQAIIKLGNALETAKASNQDTLVLHQHSPAQNPAANPAPNPDQMIHELIDLYLAKRPQEVPDQPANNLLNFPDQAQLAESKSESWAFSEFSEPAETRQTNQTIAQQALSHQNNPFVSSQQAYFNPRRTVVMSELVNKPGDNSIVPFAPLHQTHLPTQLGQILINQQELEEWQLMHALCIQKESPQSTPRLGTLLVRLGYANRQAVERALSLQLAEKQRLNNQRRVS